MTIPPFPVDYLKMEYDRLGESVADSLKAAKDAFEQRLRRHRTIAAEQRKSGPVQPVRAYLKALASVEKAVARHTSAVRKNTRLVEDLHGRRLQIVQKDGEAYLNALDDASRARILKRFKTTLKGALDQLRTLMKLYNKQVTALEKDFARLDKLEKALPVLSKRMPAR